MPGVSVNTNVRSGPSGEGEVREAQIFLAGLTQRGSTTEASLIRGVSEFENFYGGYESGNMYMDVKTYFEEGGQRAYVYRVLDTSASTSELTLNDRAGSPEPTLLVSAGSPGVWGDTVSVEVQDGDSANTFKLRFFLDDVLQYTTRDLTSPADAVSVVNTSGVKHLVTLTDLSSISAAPTNNPVVLAAANLAGGGNGTAPAEGDFVDALDFFTYDLGVGAVALPGQSGSTIWDALITHAATNNRIALLAFDETDTQETVKASVAPYYSNQNAEFASFLFPWVKVPDPATNGLFVNISPETFAGAARSKAITQVGPWRAGAGLISESSFVAGLVEDLDRDEADLLDEKRINALRKISNSFRVYGARSVDNDEDNWRYITYRDTINFIVSKAEERLEDFVFETIDSRGSLFARIEATLIALLDPMRIAGGLFEAYDAEDNLIDPGYAVEVSDVLNPPSQLAQGLVSAKVGVRISSISDTIFVTITKSNLTSSVV